MQIPKYSQLEIEKRGLVENTLLPDLSKLKCRVIEDRYLHDGRLRLRKIGWADGENHSIYKLCKKYDFPKSIELINGELGVVTTAFGQVFAATVFEFEGEKISRIYQVMNPEKLKSLSFQTNGEL